MNLIVEYYRAIIQHKALIAIIVGSCALASILLHLRAEPIYRARTLLDIQVLNADFLNIHLVDTANLTPNNMLAQTQIKLLGSQSFLSRVKDRLTTEQHSAFILRMDLLSRVQRLSHVGRPSNILYEDLLDETAKGVEIRPLDRTRQIEIICDSWDAAFAARFCNALTNEFQAAGLESRRDQAKRISDWLVRQAEDIRQKAEDFKQKLLAATGGNHQMANLENNNEGDEGLQQLQSELVHAQAARIEIEAELATAQHSEDQKNLQSESQESYARLQSEFTVAKHHEDLLAMSYYAREEHVFSGVQKNSQIEMLRYDMQAELQLYQTLLQRAKEAGLASALPLPPIRIVDAAKTPQYPFYPRRSMDVVMGLTLGGFAGVLIALFRKQTALVLRLSDDNEKFVHTNELGVISSPCCAWAFLCAYRSASKSGQSVNSLAGNGHQALSTAGWSDQLSLVAEAYRNTSLSIMLAEYAQQTKTYMITSLSTEEGRSTIVSNLGVALSKARQRVVLINGDMRQPNLHHIFSLPNQVGLRQVLLGEVPSTDISLVEICQATAFENLFVISSGSSQNTAVELPYFPSLNRLVELLVDLFDVILIDIPPMFHMRDARAFASHIRGTILVIHSEVTTREDEFTARTMLKRDGIRVIDGTLNDFDFKSSEKNGYHHSYVSYQRQSELEGHTAVRP